MPNSQTHQIHTGGAENDKKALEESSQTALEAVTNMRTVASIQKEKYFFRRYKSQLEAISKQNVKSAAVFGASYGFSQGFIFFAYAAAFVLGAHLVEVGKLTFVALMTVGNYDLLSLAAQRHYMVWGTIAEVLLKAFYCSAQCILKKTK